MCLVFDVQMQALEMVSSLLIIIARLEGLLTTSNSAKAGICNFIRPNPKTRTEGSFGKGKICGVAAIGASGWTEGDLWRSSTPLVSCHIRAADQSQSL